MILFAVILSWFVSKLAMNGALDGKLINGTEVECGPEKIPDSVLDYICLVHQHCSTDAGILVETVLENKAKQIMWTYQFCYHDLHSEQSIICDACLRWYRFRCVGLSSHPKARSWFCRACHALTK